MRVEPTCLNAGFVYFMSLLMISQKASGLCQQGCHLFGQGPLVKVNCLCVYIFMIYSVGLNY